MSRVFYEKIHHFLVESVSFTDGQHDDGFVSGAVGIYADGIGDGGFADDILQLCAVYYRQFVCGNFCRQAS